MQVHNLHLVKLLACHPLLPKARIFQISPPRKPSLSSASRPAATNQRSLDEQNDSTQALREDILNLRAAMRTETPDNETQESASSRMEGKRDQYAAQAEHEESKYNAVFRDIEVVKDLPIWAEPITMSTERMFGTFDLAADEDVLIPMGAVDGVLPGRTEYECNRLRSAIELVYNTPGDCRWENLGDATRDFTSREVSKEVFTLPHLSLWNPEES